ncbi:hypothetical protein [Niveibacterium sp. SC-1]|uniref:hypothetical protein n=1 Tax=Niveibacterium sp. SC-1 TaxID=3135646 RepID=UPI00311EB597
MKSTLRSVALSGAVLLLAACAGGGVGLPGATAQLDRLKTLQAQEKFDAIAAEEPNSDCLARPFGADACPQIHAIRGRAYLTLAMREAQPGAHCPMPTQTARANMEKAIAAYGLASGAAAAGSEDATSMAENQALALTCAAPFHRPDEAVAMTRKAVTGLDAMPPSPGRALMASSAMLSIAQRTELPAADRCAAARDAAARAHRGLTGPPAATGETAKRLQQTANAAAAGAPGLPTTCS